MNDRTGAVRVFLVAALCCSAVPAQSAEAPAGITFHAVSARETGIGKAMEAWKAAELQRQGGKFGSHGWWPWGLTAFDIDNDGDLDLMPTHHGTPRGMILRSMLRETGNLTFIDATRQFGVDTRDLPISDSLPHVWDFDGDGWLDIGGLSDETKCPSLFNEGGKKLVVADFTFHPLSYLGEVRDVNGDGYADVTGQRRSRRYTFLFDPEARTFRRTETEAPAPPDLPAEIAALLAELRKDRHNRFMRVRYLDAGGRRQRGRRDGRARHRRAAGRALPGGRSRSVCSEAGAADRLPQKAGSVRPQSDQDGPGQRHGPGPRRRDAAVRPAPGL
jgi:hypothetical protein